MVARLRKLTVGDRKALWPFAIATFLAVASVVVPSAFPPVPLIPARMVFGCSALVMAYCGWKLLQIHWVQPCTHRHNRLVRSAIAAGAMAVCGGVAVWATITIPQPYPYGQGVLKPQRDNIRSICPNLGGGIIAGRNLFEFGDARFDFLTMNHEHIISVERQGENLALSELHMRGRDGREYANFENGVFWISPLVRWSRPDNGTLKVYDPDGRPGLFVRYNNANQITVFGNFFEGNEAIILGADAVTIPPTKEAKYNAVLSSNCIGGEGVYVTSDYVYLGVDENNPRLTFERKKNPVSPRPGSVPIQHSTNETIS